MRESSVIGSLFVASAILGIVILALDTVLRTGAPTHYYTLIVFVAVDFLLGALVFSMPRTLLFRLAVLWSVLRILIQVGDVYLGPMYQFTYAQFADYLFNPLSSLPVGLGNPPGIPPVPIDLILLIDFAVIFIASKAWTKR